MKRTVALLAALVAVVVLLAALAGGVVGHVAAQETPANETAEAVAPGAQLAGVVAVQGVEARSELSQRSFAHQIATARSNASRVAIVADRVEQLRTETDALQERRQTLVAARQNGTIGPAQFRAEMAALAARSGSIAASADQTRVAAAGLDRERLAERGVNVTAIERLRMEARNATGPEAAAIARSVAGNDVGRGLSGSAVVPGGPVATPPGRNRTTDDGVRITLETPTRSAGAGGSGEGGAGPPTGVGGGPPNTGGPSTPNPPNRTTLEVSS